MKLLKWLFKSKESLQGNKDPKDYTKTKLSTDWKTDSYHCSNCLSSTSHNEYMASVCNSCGNFNTQVLYGRSYRKIFIDGKWKYQIRYKQKHEEIRDTWY